MLKTFFLNPNDDISEVIEKIVNSEFPEVFLVVPKISAARFKRNLSDFISIKKETSAAHKQVIIYSEDPNVLRLARAAGFLIRLTPPSPHLKKILSDILPSSTSAIKVKELVPEETSQKEIIKEEIEEEILEEITQKKEIPEKQKAFEKKGKIKWKRYLRLTAGLAIISGGIALALILLPRATIEIIAKKTDWSYSGSVIVYKNSSAVNIEEKSIPAEFLTLTRNVNLEFLATGKEMVKEKASGKITIYNAHSSDPQALVTNTRFLSPDGKLFRLEKTTVVPGAKILEGKIIPSSIEAIVIADQAGPEYNIGPVEHFTIPGFQGSPKYNNFYASSKEPMKGGFIGEAAVVAEEDINKAKSKLAETLKSSLEQDFILGFADKDLKFLDGAKEFKMLKEEIGVKPKERKDKFSIFGEASLNAIGFKESDLLSLLRDLAQKELGMDLTYKNFEIGYGLARADFNSKKISFPVEFKAKFTRPISLEQVRQQILGKNETELKTIIFSLPGLERAKVSLWPFWVRKVPKNERAVKISID